MSNPAQIAATSVHDLAYAKGVPNAAREAMMLMLERIAELELVNKALRMQRDAARAALAKAKESRDAGR